MVDSSSTSVVAHPTTTTTTSKQLLPPWKGAWTTHVRTEGEEGRRGWKKPRKKRLAEEGEGPPPDETATVDGTNPAKDEEDGTEVRRGG